MISLSLLSCIHFAALLHPINVTSEHALINCHVRLCLLLCTMYAEQGTCLSIP